MYDDAVSKVLASAVGANAVLAKTDGLQVLGRTLQSLLGNRAKAVEECLSRAARAGTKELESLAEQLAAPLTRCHRSFKYLWVDRRYANWLRKSAHQIVGHKIVDVIGKEAFDTFQHRLDQVLSGKHVNYEAEANYGSIGRRRITATYKPTANADGGTDGWVAFVDDITERPDNCRNQGVALKTPDPRPVST